MSKPATQEPSADIRQVSHIGARGDGVIEDEERRLYLPFTAPGDMVDIASTRQQAGKQTNAAPRITEPGPGRVTPSCRHFMVCGGCALQHLDMATIAAQKRAWLVEALSRQGFEENRITNTVSVPPGTRRRARLAYVRTAKGVILGFNRRGDRRIVDIETCPVLTPRLVDLLPKVRALAGKLPSLGKSGDIQVTAADNGIEVVFYPARPVDPGFGERETLADFAHREDLARIAWDSTGEDPEPVVSSRPVQTMFDALSVEIAPAAFLQPSQEGESLIRGTLKSAISDGSGSLRIADLFAGCGTFGLPLAAMGHRVLAIEGNTESVQAIRRATNDLPIQAEVRDLFRKPLTATELDRFDIVIFDPPRAGAARQAEEIANSSVPLVMAVSCNPATLARDLGKLRDGGYQLDRAIPIDQFTWAAHLEAVCVLKRD